MAMIPFCAAFSAAGAHGVNLLLSALIGNERRITCALILLVAVIVAVVIYVVTMLAVKGIRENEVRLLPMGNRFADYLIRKGFLEHHEQRSSRIPDQRTL